MTGHKNQLVHLEVILDPMRAHCGAQEADLRTTSLSSDTTCLCCKWGHVWDGPQGSCSRCGLHRSQWAFANEAAALRLRKRGLPT